MFLITNRPSYFPYNIPFIDAEEAVFQMSFQDNIGYDSETSSLSPFTGKMWCCQLSTREHQYLVDLETVDIQIFKGLLESKLLIIQNAVFDIPWLYKEGIIPTRIWDTYTSEFVLSMGINPGVYPRGLGDIVKRYCGVELDKSVRKDVVNGINSYETVMYSLQDVQYLHTIRDEQEKILKKRGLLKAALLDSDFTRVLAYIEYCGIYLDKDAWYKRVRQLEYEEWGYYLELEKLRVEYNSDPEFNWNSSQQVIKLFQELGVDTFCKKQKKHTVESSSLVKQAHPIVKPYLTYKEYAKAVSTYGRNFFDYILSDDRIHTKFKPIVDTGRTSCGDTKNGPFPNIQNLDSESSTRKCFQAQGDRVLVICDYSSQEGVVLADRSGEPALIEFYRSGEADMHSYVARHIFPELRGLTSAEIAKEFPHLRKAAKAAGFAINYGGSGSTIADNMGITIKEGDAVLNAYMNAFPRLKKYFDECLEETMRNGYILINPVTGRKRYIYKFKEFKDRYHDKAFWDEYKSRKAVNAITPELLTRVKEVMAIRSSLFRRSLNSPIQGTSADISKQAGVYILNWIINENLFGAVKIVNFVHDEYVLECTPNKSDLVASKTKYYMEKAGSDFLTVLHLVADPIISKKWSK